MKNVLKKQTYLYRIIFHMTFNLKININNIRLKIDLHLWNLVWILTATRNNKYFKMLYFAHFQKKKWNSTNEKSEVHIEIFKNNGRTITSLMRDNEHQEIETHI